MVRADPGPGTTPDHMPPDPTPPDHTPLGTLRTADDLRVDIDRGVTGDKIPGSDPAAAPLGTDAEAAGTPPTRREVDIEARSRTVLPHTDAPRRRHAPWVIGVCVLVAVLLVLALIVGRQTP